jgi:hypothetical protein
MFMVFVPRGRVLGGGCWAVMVAAAQFRKNSGARGFAPVQHKGMVFWAKVFFCVLRRAESGLVVAVGDGRFGGGVTGDRDDDY